MQIRTPVHEEIDRIKAESPGITQVRIAEMLGISQPIVNNILHGSMPSAETMLAVMERRGWHLDRARPDYDPLREALASAQRLRATAAPVPLLFDGKPGKKPRKPVRVHDDAPAEQSTLDELWSAVEELRALVNSTRRSSPVHGSAARGPRAARSRV